MESVDRSVNQLSSQLTGLLAEGKKPSKEELSNLLDHAKALNSGSGPSQGANGSAE